MTIALRLYRVKRLCARDKNNNFYILRRGVNKRCRTSQTSPRLFVYVCSTCEIISITCNDDRNH